MTSRLFEGVQGQYIDGSGKARMLDYGDMCLMTSPLPPLDVPTNTQVLESSVDTALNFISERGLEITSQDGNEEQGIQGIWVTTQEENPGIYYGYIPVKVSRPLQDVPFTPPTQNDPLRTDEVSQLRNFRRLSKTAELLQQYTLYTYAIDPEGFSEDSFVVIPGYEYDIESLSRRLYIEDNNIMYQRYRLIVTSDDVRERLLSYLRVSLERDRPGVLAYKNASTIPEWYKSVSDFRSGHNQLVFLSKADLNRWKQESEVIGRDTLVSSYIHKGPEPYYTRNLNINQGNLLIVQNVRNFELRRALLVSYKWVLDKVNIGYNALGTVTEVDLVSYTVYSSKGRIKKVENSTRDFASVYEYEPGKYAALLLL